VSELEERVARWTEESCRREVRVVVRGRGKRVTSSATEAERGTQCELEERVARWTEEPCRREERVVGAGTEACAFWRDGG
jgi:hypothetical protein